MDSDLSHQEPVPAHNRNGSELAGIAATRPKQEAAAC
jgi:hypothetical protein